MHKVHTVYVFLFFLFPPWITLKASFDLPSCNGIHLSVRTEEEIRCMILNILLIRVWKR